MDIKKYIPCIIVCLLVFFIIYFHPSSEKMTCDSKLQCNIEHKFLGFLTFNTKINLSEKSRMTGKVIWRRSGKDYKEDFGDFDRYNVYTVYPLITDSYGRKRSPFIYYYTGSKSEDYMDSLKFDIYSFNNYVLNPSVGYYMESAAGNLLFVYIIVASLITFGAYYIFNYIENTLKKLFKK